MGTYAEQLICSGEGKALGRHNPAVRETAASVEGGVRRCTESVSAKVAADLGTKIQKTSDNVSV